MEIICYRRIPSLQEYVLVLQDRMQVEVYRRQGEERPERCSQPEDRVHFAAVGLPLSVSEIYRNIRWSENRVPATLWLEIMAIPARCRCWR